MQRGVELQLVIECLQTQKIQTKVREMFFCFFLNTKTKKLKNYQNFVFFFNKNIILLVLQFKEISIQPELSSPTRLRIQGGVS